nr:hypothetical protein [Tanacetum cinerariifolium]GEY00454.1 hypothetical protein [Tanacetum cinerariifolium]
MLLAKQDEAGVTLTDEHNDFLAADATRMEEIKELNVNSGRVEYDTNVQASYEIEQLAKNAYKEAEKQQTNANKVKQQNKVLSQQLKLYKEKVWVFEITKGDNATFLNEFIKADSKARRLERDLQTQFICDQDIIRDLEQKQDNYILDLEAKSKENENVVLKISRSLQAIFMLRPKPMSFYDPDLKHSSGYQNPYTIRKAISQNLKIYYASCFGNTKIHANVRDTEDILDDATKSQKKMDNKFKDPISIEKKQNVCTIDYNKLNALYEDFVRQKELFADQKYFSSTYIPSENPLNASTSTSPSETKPPVASMPSSNPMKPYLEKMENEFKTLFSLLQTNSKRESIFYITPEEIRLTKFCQQEVKPILHKLH